MLFISNGKELSTMPHGCEDSVRQSVRQQVSEKIEETALCEDVRHLSSMYVGACVDL